MIECTVVFKYSEINEIYFQIKTGFTGVFLKFTYPMSLSAAQDWDATLLSFE